MKELTILEVEEVSGGMDLIAALWRSALVRVSVWASAYEITTDLGEGFAQGMEKAHKEYLEGSCKIDDPIRWP